MSETTQDLLRRGLEILESYAVWQSDVVGAEQDAAALDAVAVLVRRELEAPATGEDVRQRVARELAGHRENYDSPDWYDYEVADRILALLRTPRGEGEAWRAFLDALDEFEAAANLWADPEGPTAADMERLRQSRQRVIECARVLAALRSDAQGEVWREVDDLLARLERFAYDAAGESEEYWRVVAMRDRIAAARRGEGGGDGE